MHGFKEAPNVAPQQAKQLAHPLLRRVALHTGQFDDPIHMLPMPKHKGQYVTNIICPRGRLPRNARQLFKIGDPNDIAGFQGPGRHMPPLGKVKLPAGLEVGLQVEIGIDPIEMLDVIIVE